MGAWADWASILSFALTLVNFLLLLNTRRAIDQEVSSVRFETQKAQAVSNCASATTILIHVRGAARRGDWVLVTERLPEVRNAIVGLSTLAPAIGADIGKTLEEFLSQLTVLETQAEKATGDSGSVNIDSIKRSIIKQYGRLSTIQTACESALNTRKSIPWWHLGSGRQS